MTGLLALPRTKAKPGPGPTPEALLRALDLTVGRRVRGLIPGEFRALDLGGGTELAQVRPYEPGDDVRRMDWNVTARTTVPHVRIHVPERGLTTWLVLDTSASMTFGTADRRKADVAEGVALAVGHLATQRSNRLGLVTAGSTGPSRVLRPAAGRAGLLGVLLTLRRDEQTAEGGTEVGTGTLRDALRTIAAVAPRGGLVAVVSDFRGPRDWNRSLGAVVARHQVLAVEIRDPREDDLPDVGELTLIDAETGREVVVDTASRRFRDRFRTAAAAERAEIARELRRLGAGHVVLTTAGSWLRDFASQLRVLRIAS